MNQESIDKLTADQRAVLARVAHDALLVQDACNLSGVLHSFLAAVATLRELGVYTREHPVCRAHTGAWQRDVCRYLRLWRNARDGM